MQIIIPMSGFGERFRKAGYSVPKPLINVDGKPIIAHVIDMFPGETDFIFVCNQDHLNEPAYRMEEILRQYCPTGSIVGIEAHKLGPIHAVLQVADRLDPTQPVIVNYCDFTCYWDWSDFRSFVQETACIGCIPAYKGFHPHTLGSTNYAYMREVDGWVQDIQEKQPYTDNRMEEYASSGTYYFANAKIMQQAFKQAMDQNLNVGGEFYVSLAYKPLLADHQPIAVYPIQHFMQWGTPADLAEYLNWSKAFQTLANPAPELPAATGSLVIPMAGLGQRFQNEGYTLTKPLILVSGTAMVTQAAADLPASQYQSFVLRSDMPGHTEIAQELTSIYPGAVIESIPGVTEGQACTALIGLEALLSQHPAANGPFTFGACDNGALYDAQRLSKMMHDSDIDVIVWGVRGHANAVRHPQMFGWINADSQGNVQSISVKQPLEEPATDPIVLGTFTFRRADDFKRCVAHLIARNGRINTEFYIDAAINDAIELGLHCKLFEVDSFLCWGTPNDLKTFEYWQSCFHKWAHHPYQLDRDQRIPNASIPELEARYRSLNVHRPATRGLASAS